MNASKRMNEIAGASAVLLGVLADQLIRVPGRPGLNVTLWALAGCAALWVAARAREIPMAPETRWLVGGAVGFAGLLMLRDAEGLAVFSLFSAVVLLGLAAGRSALAWAARANITEIAAAAVRVAVLIALGPFGWSIGAVRQPVGGARRAWPQHARVVARGTIMAVPPLLILTALLTSADPVFEHVLHAALIDSLEPLLEHLLFAGVIAWLTSGYLRAFLVSDDVVMERVRLPRPTIAPAEIAVALSLLNLLFIAFLVVQVRYLFGGSGLVEVTEGLSYAEYARRGFFELLAATAFVVPVLLIADWAAAGDALRRRVLRATSISLVVLLGGVLASAAYRMWLYQGAYGLTEDRLYGSMVMVWLAVVLAWLTLTVLRGRRRGFAFGAVVAGLACIAALHALNPHALIARVNISRAAAGAEVDGAYLRTLSADAVPTLLARMGALPQAERCRVANMIEERWSGERRGGWRTWNLSDARARQRVAEISLPAECAATSPTAS